MDLSGQAGNPRTNFLSKIAHRQLLTSATSRARPGMRADRAGLILYPSSVPTRYHPNCDTVLNPDRCTPIEADPVRIVRARPCLVQ